MTPIPKPEPQKVIRKKLRAKAATSERKAKQEARDRDKGCRFPLCGCRTLHYPLEVAHVKHKGMGSRLGRAKVNVRTNLITLCQHRHQTGVISIHRGTLKMEPATDRGTDGPMIWTIDTSPLGVEFGYLRIRVREMNPGPFEPYLTEQVLTRLSRMDV